MSNPALIEVVDDDPDIRRMLQLVLEARGFKVRIHDGAHAYLAAEPVTERRVMLLDVRMPKMTGVELQAQMVKAGNRIPVIFMSGESLPHETLAAQQFLEPNAHLRSRTLRRWRAQVLGRLQQLSRSVR